jgi:hypothetical protein
MRDRTYSMEAARISSLNFFSNENRRVEAEREARTVYVRPHTGNRSSFSLFKRT